MKKIRSYQIALSGVTIAVVVMVGLLIYSRFFLTQSIQPVSSLPQQAAGQAAMNETFLKGGLLQRSLKGHVQAQEFITVETGKNVPKYLKREFTVHAGKIVSVTLHNHSQLNQEHDWVLVQPGTRNDVQAAARKTPLIWQWIPDTPDILAFVPMTKPGKSTTRLFRAPSEPGDYPFLCTFPGHGNVMNGILHVIGESNE